VSRLVTLIEKYRPVFDEIAAGAVSRERKRELPFEPLRRLAQSGFTAVRVPVELGGDGASLPEFFDLLVLLAAADPNVPQALRGHFAFVEDRLWASASPDRDEWLRRFTAGEIVGNAVTEIGDVRLGDTSTRVLKTAEGWSIAGRKYYTTGSIFADWIDATALAPDGSEVAALVRTAQAGVTVSDDWTGFGQRLTGSGTTVFTDAKAEHVYPFSERFPYQTPFYQLVLDAVLAGIATAVERDAADAVRRRTRSFSHANTALVRDDPQILELIGRISADAFAAAGAVSRAAHELQRVADARLGATAEIAIAKRDAELASARAQIVTSQIAVDTASAFFDALGASATDTAALLDRHWRNARTVRSHNPLAYKARIVGDFVVNGTEPPYEWAVGTRAPRQAAPQRDTNGAAR
jgi:alkylation response protein AidB-like acyl-CoA dehydrogenase